MNKLLVFSAPWCKPCQMMKPVLESLNSPNIIHYDLDSDTEQVDKYRVPGVPCYILVDEDGKELDMLLGLASIETLQELLSR